MSKYTKEFKRAVVQDYELLKLGSRALSKKYNVTRSLLKKWIYGYQCHGSDYFEKRTQSYSAEFKLSVLQHIKDYNISPTRAAALFGIPAFTTVMQWQRLYNSCGVDALVAKPRGRTKMTKPKPKADTPLKR